MSFVGSRKPSRRCWCSAACGVVWGLCCAPTEPRRAEAFPCFSALVSTRQARRRLAETTTLRIGIVDLTGAVSSTTYVSCAYAPRAHRPLSSHGMQRKDVIPSHPPDRTDLVHTKDRTRERDTCRCRPAGSTTRHPSTVLVIGEIQFDSFT